jgi:methyl-accepting chemotaxis protein
MIQAAKDQAQAQASSHAGVIDAEIETALDTARTLAQVFTSVKDGGIKLSRQQANAMLKQVLVDNPQFVGISTAWEPDAFDRRDANHIGTVGHDETGRFIPYWARSGEEIILTPLMDYEVKGTGDYYLIPKRTKQEAIIDHMYTRLMGRMS